MKPFEVRNAHFDRLVNTPDLRWMGQNTNHAKPHAAVIEAMERCIRDEEFHVYAPPAGLEELRQGIVSDLGLKDHAALVSDGAVSSLYHVCHTLLKRKAGRRIETDLVEPPKSSNLRMVPS